MKVELDYHDRQRVLAAVKTATILPKMREYIIALMDRPSAETLDLTHSAPKIDAAKDELWIMLGSAIALTAASENHRARRFYAWLAAHAANQLRAERPKRRI